MDVPSGFLDINNAVRSAAALGPPNKWKSPIRQISALHIQINCTYIAVSGVSMTEVLTLDNRYDLRSMVHTISTMKLGVAKILQKTWVGKIFILIVMYFTQIFQL